MESLFLLLVLSILFLLLLSGIVAGSVARFVSRIMMFIEASFFIHISMYFFTRGKKKYSALLLAIYRLIIYIFAFYMIFWKFENAVEISLQSGSRIESQYVFNENMRDVLPLKWAEVYIVFFRFLLPGFSCLIMLLKNEYKGTRLEKFRGFLDALAFFCMCALLFWVGLVSNHVPAFSLIYIVAYFFLVSLMYYALMQESVPTRNDAFAFLYHISYTYIMPALIFIELYDALFNTYAEKPAVFLFVLAAVAAGALIIVWRIDIIFENIRLIRSTDYEQEFEDELGLISYEDEMPVIAEKMIAIFKKYVTCSSVTLLINNGAGQMEVACSSLEAAASIPVDAVPLDELLKAGENIVAYNEIGKKHGLALVRSKFTDFFAATNSDALIVLNEGQNVFGCMLLGVKVNGDHYSSYDVSVFTHLYSYFFVFGYYMKNISNKDIIGTVNKEIKMSSQVIASIQENVDAIDNKKMDAGYIMKPAHNIGGEFIDLIRINNQTHLFVIGSLSGQGIAASMSMVILKSVIRTFLAGTHDFKELVEKVNSFVRENLPKGTIFAGMFALIDFRTDTMYYINCGISSLFLYTQAYNNVIEIQGRGYILGFVRDITPYISLRQIKLNAGDIILACTKGLLTSRSLRGDEFGKDRVQQTLLSNITYSAQRVAQFEYDSLVKFMSKEIEDDVSILVMKYGGSAMHYTN
ncbi:MAG: serine/threonine-protein phosphatase [Treponema sp.]|nr:serine/threonine-protein phosphatase [Treponema sp.]